MLHLRCLTVLNMRLVLVIYLFTFISDALGSVFYTVMVKVYGTEEALKINLKLKHAVADSHKFSIF